MNIISLDACKTGWCGIGQIDAQLVWGCFQNLEELVKTHPKLDRILIDIPIGLSSKNFRRTLDKKARTLLNKRKSSIFSPPCREALYADNYREALAINRQICGMGISIQAYNIGNKIRAVDEWYKHKSASIQVYEAHPELCFKSLNDNQDLKFSKHDKAGLKERMNILFKLDKSLKNVYKNLLENYKRSEVKPDDILDAMALFLINLKPEPLKIVEDTNTTDETGKPVRIVYG